MIHTMVADVPKSKVRNQNIVPKLLHMHVTAQKNKILIGNTSSCSYAAGGNIQ